MKSVIVFSAPPDILSLISSFYFRFLINALSNVGFYMRC